MRQTGSAHGTMRRIWMIDRRPEAPRRLARVHVVVDQPFAANAAPGGLCQRDLIVERRVGKRVHAIYAIEQMNFWFDDEANGQARVGADLKESDDGKIAK